MQIDSGTYSIHIGGDALAELNNFLKLNYSGRKKFILVDENTHHHCLPVISFHIPELKNAAILEIESGEENKDLQVCQGLWGSLLEFQADRSSVLINIGGGVIGDMGGFVAATFKRGIDFIQVPTTLLAQVDASVGGKTGVDFNHYKNLLGAFCDPKGVFIDPSFLSTLDKRQLYSGYAEIIKHALIGDRALWERLGSFELSMDLEVARWVEVIGTSIGIKNKIVLEDPREKGTRKKLNFGHTVGHALESLLLEKRKEVFHGEAISMGMICETHLSWQMGLLSEKKSNRIIDFILENYPLIDISERDKMKLLDFMMADKKNFQGKINFTLLKDIGSAETDHFCDSKTIINSLDYYLGLGRK